MSLIYYPFRITAACVVAIINGVVRMLVWIWSLIPVLDIDFSWAHARFQCVGSASACAAEKARRLYLETLDGKDSVAMEVALRAYREAYSRIRGWATVAAYKWEIGSAFQLAVTDVPPPIPETRVYWFSLVVSMLWNLLVQTIFFVLVIVVSSLVLTASVWVYTTSLRYKAYPWKLRLLQTATIVLTKWRAVLATAILMEEQAIKFKEIVEIMDSNLVNGPEPEGEEDFSDAEASEESESVELVEGVEATDGTTEVLVGMDVVEQRFRDIYGEDARAGYLAVDLPGMDHMQHLEAVKLGSDSVAMEIDIKDLSPDMVRGQSNPFFAGRCYLLLFDENCWGVLAKAYDFLPVTLIVATLRDDTISKQTIKYKMVANGRLAHIVRGWHEEEGYSKEMSVEKFLEVVPKMALI